MFKKIVILALVLWGINQAFKASFFELPPERAIRHLTQKPEFFDFDDYDYAGSIKLGEWVDQAFTVHVVVGGNYRLKRGEYQVRLNTYEYERLEPLPAPEELDSRDGQLYPVRVLRSFSYQYNEADMVHKELSRTLPFEHSQEFVCELYQSRLDPEHIWRIRETEYSKNRFTKPRH